MMRIIQITLLWIAGALVLGHGIIPHHHHHENQKHCSSENQAHKHKAALEFTDTCACNHADAHAEPCTLDTKTKVEKTQLLSSALNVENLNISIPDNFSGLLYPESTTYILSDPLFEHGPSRAPPTV